MNSKQISFNKAIKNGAAWALLAGLLSFNAYGASEEIQVYLDDKEEAGQVSVDWHNNYVFSGRSTPQYRGEQAPARVYRLTPELNIGLTDTLELGFYLLSSLDRQGNLAGDGGKVRLKYITPHAEEGLFWGLNLEVGEQAKRVSPNPWNAQLKGIWGLHEGRWTLGTNLNIDTPLDPHSGSPTVDVDFKINYRVAEKTEFGLESYNELGALHHLDSINKNSKTLFTVVDTEVAGLDLSVGLGKGLTPDSDKWLVKLILGTKSW
jgi:hypothetical protein